MSSCSSWENGVEPSETEHDLTAPFEILGEIAARMHRHAMGWRRPPGFERHRWDFATSLGERRIGVGGATAWG